MSAYLNIDTLPCHWRSRLREFACRAIHIGIVRAPDDVSGANPASLNRAATKTELDAAAASFDDLENVASLFGLLGAAPIRGIEHQAVARLERS